MSADFTPGLSPYKETGTFRFWCQKVLPLVYDNSLSYYELLNKVVNYLNDVIYNVDGIRTDTEALRTAYIELQGYVNNYFDNLDVQEQINNKLDEMAEDGTLSGLINPLIPDAVSDWLENNLNPTTPPVDATLSISGAAADAKVTGDKIAQLNTEMAKLYTVTDNFVSNTPDFWIQGIQPGQSQGYAVHSDKIPITDHSALYGGGIINGEPFSDSTNIRIRFFDSNDNVLYTGGATILSNTWAYFGTSALIQYPDTAYIIIIISTNYANIPITPESCAEKIQSYIGYTEITTIDDFYDKYSPKVDLLEIKTNDLEDTVETLSDTVGQQQEQLTTAENDIIDLNERLTDLENLPPDYWISHLDSKIETLRNLDGVVGAHGFSFIFITDVHWENNFKESPAIINYLLKHTNIDYVICGGDILTKNNSISAAMDVINEWQEKNKTLNMITIYGNHDNNSNGGNASDLWIGYDRWYGAVLKPVENEVAWDPTKHYFYIDNQAQKVRCIFLNTGYDQGAGLDNTQAAWLQQRLYELGNGWTAVTLQHIFFMPATIESGITELQIAGSGALARNMVNGQLPGLRNRGANFAAMICGHVHRDYSITDENGYPIIATTCDANGLQASLYDPVNPNRQQGTISEQIFDVYHIDTQNKNIYITRIGAGSDRTFSYT